MTEERMVSGNEAAAQLPSINIEASQASTQISTTEDEKIVIVLGKTVNPDGSMTFTTEDIIALPKGYTLSVTKEDYDSFFKEEIGSELEDSEDSGQWEIWDDEIEEPGDYETDADEG